MKPQSPISATIAAGALLLIAAIMPAHADTLYQNVYPSSYGPSPLYSAGVQIDGFNESSDSFTLASNATVTSFDFIGFTDPGASLSSLDWSISNSDFSTPIASSAAVVSSGLDLGDHTAQSATYDFKDYSFSTAPVSLSAGTYYLNLDDAVTTDSGSAYWNDQYYGTSQGYHVYSDPPTVYGPYTAGSESLSVNGTPVAAPESSSITDMLMASTVLAGFALFGARRRAASK